MARGPTNFWTIRFRNCCEYGFTETSCPFTIFAAADRPPASCDNYPGTWGKAARFFDVKEHWIALGLFVSGALLMLLVMWDPYRDALALAPIAIGFAVIVRRRLARRDHWRADRGLASV